MIPTRALLEGLRSGSTFAVMIGSLFRLPSERRRRRHENREGNKSGAN